MTGSILQLVAIGKQDIYLIKKPQITFFKTLYRRHTNFSREDIPQNFSHEPNFGKRATCIISRDSGDLIDNMAIRMILPAIPKNDVKFAWIKNIGHAILKFVEIEINGIIIDRHYGEWLHIWSQLTTRNIMDNGIDKLIGNVPELYEFTYYKNEYILYIPLYFWFCRTGGLALPLISLKFSDIKLNIEFYDFDKCYILSPTHYIKCIDDIVNFNNYEYIKQNDKYGIYSHYDSINKRLYYTPLNKQYLLTSECEIVGNTTKFTAKPELNTCSLIVHHKSLKNIKIKDCHILVGYVYIDIEERMKFAQSRHDYLIEQLYFTPNIKIENTYTKVKLVIDNPCKLMIWVAQLDNMTEQNRFNYTNIHNESLFIKDKIQLNSQDRLSDRPHEYYYNIQSLQHTNNSIPRGCGMYSYAIQPTETYPSGTTNMSQIELIELKLTMHACINVYNKATFRAYGLCYNILRIDNGLCGKLFIN